MMNRINQARKAYNSVVTPGAKGMQEALMKLLGGHPVESPASARRVLGEMAGGDEMLALLKALPAAAAVGGVGSAIGSTGDLVTGEEAPNRAMDLLGMGAGAYGMHRGRVGGTTPAGRALSIMAGMGLGKLGSDATQGAIGGMF